MGDLQFYLNVAVTGLSIGAVYALFGTGITLIYKGTRVPNFAHAAVGTIGAYTFVKFWDGTQLQDPGLGFQLPFTSLSWTPDPPALPFAAALLIALVVTGLLGLAIERVVMRPLANAPMLNLIIVTIALFTLLTGHPPFVGHNLGEVAKHHAQTPPPDVRQQCPAAPAAARGRGCP